jgi:hypothetical protein
MDWLKKPLRIADFNLINMQEMKQGAFQVEKNIDIKDCLGFNAEHFYLDKSGSIAHGSINPAWHTLKQYLEAAHKRGIKLLIYYNVHWYSLELGKEKPDWFQYDYRGRLIDKVYGNGVMSCVNAVWREHSFEYIRKFTELGVDGIFLDGPVFHPEGCYCDACRDKFKERYGKKLPKKGDPATTDHMLLVEFQEDSMADYMRDAYAACKEINPDAVIYLNGESLRPSWASGRNNRKLEPYQDIVGAEGGFIYGKLIDSPIFKPGMTAKGLEAQAPDKPRVIFIAHKHSPWNRNPLPGPELKIECAQTLANGANYWIGYTFPDKAADATIKEINGWVSNNEEYFSETLNAAEVGLFWSYETANTYGGEIPQSDFTGETIKVKKDYMKSFQGAYEMLQKAHIPFKVVDRFKDAAGVKLLILPNCACMTSDETSLLEEYVRGGGKLIVSFETSLYSRGKLLEDFSLSKLLGASYLGIEEYGTNENYFKIEDEFFPAYTYVLKVKGQASEAMGYVAHNTKGSYQPVNFSSFPAVCKNEFEDGRVYFFCGNFFQSYSDFKFPKYLSLFKRIFDSEFSRQIIVENAPQSVEVTLRKKGNTLIVHLINFSSGLKRPIESIIPVKNIKLKIPGRQASKVTCLISRVQPDWQIRDDFLEITVPEVQEYEIIAVE